MAILKGHWFCRQDNHWQVIFRQHHLTGALVLTLSVFPSPPGVELNCTMLIDFKLVLATRVRFDRNSRELLYRILVFLTHSFSSTSSSISTNFNSW